jgi:hypothetical protein
LHRAIVGRFHEAPVSTLEIRRFRHDFEEDRTAKDRYEDGMQRERNGKIPRVAELVDNPLKDRG